ncbi:MAG: ribosome small subunit-dependent GTPase A [Spirochaetales bacterium]|nr:ribosome small subunit-dependent GTPase A [Spirochaetales bacterium]
MRATILHGINNIYAVAHNGKHYDCVIKGKQLKGTGRSYAPLAPGDEVALELQSSGFSQITERIERRNEFSRWNTKGKAVQTLAANVDLVVCVCSPESPPFRPRFVDRVQVTCGIENIPLLVVLNKNDQGVSPEIRNRLRVYKKTNCAVLECSVLTGRGVEKIAKYIAGRRCVFCGQSGVGKTSIINSILPEANLAVGSISAKYNRGRHVTRYGILLDNPKGGWIVDTPGIRELEIVEIEPADLSFYFPEMAHYREQCAVSGCTHDHEPGCAVFEAVRAGKIHEDRFESYLRILESLTNREQLYGSPQR